MADSLSFDGVDLSAYGVTVVDGPIQFLSKPRLSTAQRSREHGAIVRGKFLEPRVLSVPVVVKGQDFNDLLANWQNIRSLLRPSKGEKKIVLDYQSDRFYVGRLQEGLSAAPAGGQRAVGTTLQFFCPDPTTYDVTQRTQNTATTSLSFTPGGNEETRCIITGVNGNASAAAAIEVIHSPSQAVFKTTYPLAANERIRLDGERQIAEVSHDGVTWAAIMKSVDNYAHEFARLTPAVLNTFTLTGLAGTYSWTVTYYDRYL
ncbi:MAG: hypothetical protein GHCLOJNM_03064 [bacterium]|nr:hypothetical protein [bacterium]